MAPPSLPVERIRAALDAGEWGLARRLLGEHQLALRDALEQADLRHQPIAPWHELLAAQHALQAELHASREQVAQQLEKLGNDHRGARAWLRELA